MGVTDDRSDPRLTHGADTEPVPMAEVYLVLSDEERARGFTRPLRASYVHVGPPGPRHPLVDLTPEQAERYGDVYVKFEPYDDPAGGGATGRFWTAGRLAAVGSGCGGVTTMGAAIAETYAREPGFYGATYCCGCGMHRPVGADGEFVWDGTTERVGT